MPQRRLFTSPILMGLAFAGAVVPRMARAESAESLARQGSQYYQQERLQEAIDRYRDAIRHDPDSPLIQYNLGTALASDGRYDDAIKALQQAAGSKDRLAGDASFNLGVSQADAALEAHPKVRDLLKTLPAAPAKIPEKAAESVDPKAVQESIDQLQTALGSFRDAVLKNGQNNEDKYNYEVTSEMVQRLKEIQQIQQQQQQKKNQQQQQNKQQQGQGKSDQQQQNQQQQNKDQQNQQQQQSKDQQKQQQQNQQDQQKQGEQQKQQQQQPGGGLEKTPTPTPTPNPSQQHNQQPQQNQQQQNQQQQNQQQQNQQPQPGQAGQPQGEPKPLTNDQMDAMRLLQLLENDKPEQFKRLFQFHGRSEANPPAKDW